MSTEFYKIRSSRDDSDLSYERGAVTGQLACTCFIRIDIKVGYFYDRDGVEEGRRAEGRAEKEKEKESWLPEQSIHGPVLWCFYSVGELLESLLWKLELRLGWSRLARRLGREGECP